MQINPGKPKVIIVGAGIGGIATAARLARHGCQVTVLEKCEIPGGRCSQMSVDGYTFDTGATLFLLPDLYAQTFAALGERLQDHLDLRRVDPTYQLTFPDDTRLHLTSDLHRMQAQQLEAIEPGSFARMLHYLGEGRRIYELALPELLGRDFRSLPGFINPHMLRLFLRVKALTRHTSYVGHFFRDPRLQMAFTFQDMYMGLSPYDSPATYSFMQSTELADGLWYPMGGMYRLTGALTGIAEKLGVRFLYNAPVQKILVEGSRATGVLLENGDVLSADTVVANADLGYVYRGLLPDDGMASRIDRMEYGCSTIMFYWGLDKQYPQLGPHNLFLNGDYRRSFEEIFKQTGMPDEPNFYIHAPVRLDPSMAPAGHDTWYVAVPVGHINSKISQDWPAMRSCARAFILQRLARLGLSDVEAHIRTELSFVPRDWQNRYNLTHGSTHGLSHKLTQMAYLRPHNRHSRYHNLYFVGASTHPGTGVPTVLVSAGLGHPAHTGGDTSMTDPTASLAHSITWAGSKQSYLIARFLADRDLSDDCLRAYAYFRWADDMIDIVLLNDEDRSVFIERQKALIDRLYRGEHPDGLSAEEAMLADLIAHDRLPASGLGSFIHNFMAVIEFDAHRHGRIANRQELAAYTTCLATAVMDGIQYFIGNGHPYPKTPDRNLAVAGAHITHMLRDMLEDFSVGLVNIPAEDLQAYDIAVKELNGEPFRLWVREQVRLARHCFREGKTYIDSLDLLRCKLAGVWYCARFECVLNLIERDGCRLRADYHSHHTLNTWLQMACLGVTVTLKHFASRIRLFFFPPGHTTGIKTRLNLPSQDIQ